MKIVLASASPRRRQLLKSLGLKFTVHPSDFQEIQDRTLATVEGDCSTVSSLTAEKLVLLNAIGKSQSIAHHYSNAIIIAADTVGAYQHHILEKPKNSTDALRILKILNNTTHDVLTGLCVLNTKTKQEIHHIEKTAVTFSNMTLAEMQAYIQTGEPMDKSAAFAISGFGSLFIKKVNGCFFNVMGIPIFSLYQILKKFGIKLL